MFKRKSDIPVESGGAYFSHRNFYMQTQEEYEQEKVVAFLLELAELTKKHSITINGCGCDGSPWLQFTDDKLSPDHSVFNGLEYSYDTHSYTVAGMEGR